jgi:anti-sigma factor RsiW
MRCEHCQEALNGYVDDELLLEERREIDEHLADCAACIRERDTLVETRHMLKENLVHYAAPDVLKARIRAEVAREDFDTSTESNRAPTPAPRRTPWWTYAAAAVLVAAASSTLTVAVMRPRETEARVNSELVSAHVRSLIPGHLTDILSTDQHNVKPWFNGRVDLAPSVPDLTTQNFHLLGGRVDYVDGHVSPVVVYQRRQHIINVYSSPADKAGDSALEATTVNGYHVLRWSHDGLTQWAVSDINAKELREFVTDFTGAEGGTSR